MDPESRGRPAAEVHVDVALVRRLLATQFPQWAELPVAPVESAGWDNTIFRLGRHLALRFPRRLLGAGHLLTERQWLPVVGPRLPLAVPVPIGNGVPAEGYPWHWSVCPWLDGERAAATPVADAHQAAMLLARFIVSLHAIDAGGGPVSELRGSLAARDHVTRAAAAALRDGLDTRPVLAAWDAALAAPGPAGQPSWIHGDLHPANLLVKDGELTAVIDFGLLGLGDPACDLMVAWTYLPAGARDAFRSALAVDDAAWCRGRGWALELALRCAAYSADDLLGDIGRRTIAEVVRDFRQNSR
jgi:aminoglycoside phosphotransferase (APT) family kinase protein